MLVNATPHASMEGANGSVPALSKGEARSSPISTLVSSLGSMETVTALSSVLNTSVPGLTPHTDAARNHFSALWRSAQPWTEFFNRKKFVPPTSATELRERLVDNLTHFSANYLICFFAVSIASVLVHPLSFLCVCLLLVLYVIFFLQNPEQLKVGPLSIPANAKIVVFGAITALLLYLTNAVAILGSWALFSIILSLLHAGGRVSAKEPDFESPVGASV